MDFLDAVKTMFFRKYATFSGRATRSEYWWAQLAMMIVSFILSIINAIVAMLIGLSVKSENDLENALIVMIIAQLLIFVPFIFGTITPLWAVAVRRLHDIGRSGWHLLLGLIPFVGGIILLVFFVQDSEPKDNQYGSYPKKNISPTPYRP